MIGVFDSGIGGLTVVREIAALMPSLDIAYLGDTARVPYGVRSPETVRRYALEGSAFLLSKGIDLLVIACNTVSAVALDDVVRASAPVPVIGVIHPGARAAASATASGSIGVIGTEATVRSGAYSQAITTLKADVRISSAACPLFVPLVEEGWLEGEVPELVAARYLATLKSGKIDTLVLGCTHYPLLKPMLGKVMGPSVTLIDSATETAREVRSMLGPAASGSGKMKFHVTDSPAKFAEVGGRFLGSRIEDITKVELEAHT